MPFLRCDFAIKNLLREWILQDCLASKEKKEKEMKLLLLSMLLLTGCVSIKQHREVIHDNQNLAQENLELQLQNSVLRYEVEQYRKAGSPEDAERRAKMSNPYK